MEREIEITAADGGHFACYLAVPERPPGAGLVMLPEVFNTNRHIRELADAYSREGFVVMAPDVYWRQAPGSYQAYTDEGFEHSKALRERLDEDQWAADMGDIVAALRARPDCTGRIGVMGFCLGGRFAYLAATRLPVDAAVAYYGTRIHERLGEADAIGCPILMHFATIDEHVPPDTVDMIRARLETRADVEIHLYDGAGHGFNRDGYPSYAPRAAALARERTLAHFRRHLGAD